MYLIKIQVICCLKIQRYFKQSNIIAFSHLVAQI